MSRSPTAATRVIALLGNPVAHSLSPTFQNAALASLGLDAVYLALRCDREHLPGLLIGIARAGGAGNVTLPHKEEAARLVERRTEAVVRTGSCNTYWLEDDLVCGDNTDVAGFRAAATSLVGHPLRGARVLLLGAGGAARGVAFALILEGVEEIVILNRSPGAAEELRSRLAAGGSRVRTVTGAESLRGTDFDLVVNGTSLGLRPDDPLPLAEDAGIGISAAIDLVYRVETTAWTRQLQARGVPAEDGLEMLLQQGAAAFARWWDVDPPLQAMRAALPRR